MKKLLLIIGIFTVIIGCRKDDAANTNLVGNWKLTGRACNCAAVDFLSNELTLSFTLDTYKRDWQGGPQNSGSYVVVKDKLNNQYVNRIIYNGDTTSAKIFFKIQGKKLTLYGETPVAADGIEEYYEKQ